MLSFLSLPLALATAQPAPPFLRDPDVHGDTVAFSCEGDLWLGDLRSGAATRLTRHEGRESGARFSPDGKTLAFTAEYDGVQEVYTMQTTGGPPKRLTYLNALAEALDWTPDGRSVVVRARPAPTRGKVYLVPAEGGFPQELPLEFASHVSFAPDGNRFAWTRYWRHAAAWFRYEGGQKNAVWTANLADKRFRRIFEMKGTCEFPVWAGDRVYFATDLGGSFGVRSVLPDGSSPKRLGADGDKEIRSLQTDGRRIVFERGFDLELADPETGDSKVLRFDLKSDLMHTRPYRAPAGDFLLAASIGPTGKRVFAEARGQLLSLPVGEGEAKVLVAKAGVRYRTPAMSPDGTKIAFIGDETGEQQLYVADADGVGPKQLTPVPDEHRESGKDANRQLRVIRWSPDSKWVAAGDSEFMLRLIEVESGRELKFGPSMWWQAPDFDFSPDSKWLAFDLYHPLTHLRSLSLYELSTGKTTTLGREFSDDFAPRFSPDGKWLLFLSRRNFSPRWDGMQNAIVTLDVVRPCVLSLRSDESSPFAAKSEEEPKGAQKEEKKEPPPFRLDLDGLYGRMFELPLAPGSYSAPAWAGDRAFFLSSDGTSTSLAYYDLKAKQFGSLGATEEYHVSSDRKKLLLRSGTRMQVVDAAATSITAETGRVAFGGLQLWIDPIPEWRQIFWDAWRLHRDHFYVENMDGADWKAVGEKYARLLPSVRSRDELNELIRWMQAELATSHMGRFGGDVRSLMRPAEQAFLGLDVEPDSNGHYRIKRLYGGDGMREAERSPLLAPGLDVKEGMFLIEVAGTLVRHGSDWQSGLQGRAGQVVSVKVNDRPSAEGARTVFVKPVTSESRMRYLSWVEDNRAYVAKASGGKVGYLHLRAMVMSDFADFLRQYFPQRKLDALIVDVRFNTGGNISDQICTILKQKLVVAWNQRSHPSFWTRQDDYFAGHLACLINEFSFSDGEEFPYQWRKLGLGPLFGRRTGGGEVGSDPGWPLIDGGRVSVPNYGAFTMDEGWIIEGPGVAPDIEVQSDPNAYARGVDPQLDRAVAYLLDKIAKEPVQRPKPPPDPARIKPPTG